MIDRQSSWLVEHRRGTRNQGRRDLLLVAILFPIFFSIGAFILLYARDRWFATFWFVILAVVTLVQLVMAGVNWTTDGEFFCRLSAEWLECHCPPKGLGDSFRIPVSEIDELEETQGESPRWYVWDHARRRYWLTSNYGNPAFEFVQKLRELRPDLRG